MTVSPTARHHWGPPSPPPPADGCAGYPDQTHCEHSRLSCRCSAIRQTKYPPSCHPPSCRPPVVLLSSRALMLLGWTELTRPAGADVQVDSRRVRRVRLLQSDGKDGLRLRPPRCPAMRHVAQSHAPQQRRGWLRPAAELTAVAVGLGSDYDPACQGIATKDLRCIWDADASSCGQDTTTVRAEALRA